MKLKLIFCIITIYATSFFSQSKDQYALANVQYELKIKLDKNISRHEYFLETFPNSSSNIGSVASEFDFVLMFDEKNSLFFLEKKLISDKKAGMLATILSGYFGRIKQYDNNYVTEELQESFGKFLVSREYKKWQLHEETKKIDKYLCFKATTSFTIINPKGKIFKRDITAWYAPQLPYKYGPLGYGNLPGLIIELQGEGYTYGVKKIEFFDEKNKKNLIPKLKNKKLITEEEFERLAAEDEKRWRKRHN